jgi:hypothetical protein
LKDWVPSFGIAFALLMLCWRIWIVGSEQPVWPAVERNQGLITLIALAAALAAIWYQRHLTQTETARRAHEHVVVVLELADSYLADLSRILEMQGITAAALEHWNRSRKSKRKTLDLLRQSSPPDGRLVLLQGNLDDGFENPFWSRDTEIQLPSDGAHARLRQKFDELTEARDRLSPKSVASVS